MNSYRCLTLREDPALKDAAAQWFHEKWGVPKEAYLEVCAVYTEEAYRGQGIAGHLLNMVVDEMKAKGISPLYLVTDHTGFYERYGWEYLCMVQGDGEPDMTRMYIHR